MSDLSPCPKCGSTDIEGPTPSRRRAEFGASKYRKQMRFNCAGCDHVYQFDAKGETAKSRESNARAMWEAARPAQMKPTMRLAAELGLLD